MKEFSAEVREQNAKYQEKLPGLRKDAERTRFLKVRQFFFFLVPFLTTASFLQANISTLTVDDLRPSNPEIFAAIDKEIDEYNWDDEPVVETAHKEKHH